MVCLWWIIKKDYISFIIFNGFPIILSCLNLLKSQAFKIGTYKIKSCLLQYNLKASIF